MHQLKDWAGTPAIFVLDCSAAGILLKHFVEPQPPVEEGDGVVNPDTPPRGDGSGGSGVGGAAAGNVGGPPSNMSESVALYFYRFFFVVLPVVCFVWFGIVLSCPHVLLSGLHTVRTAA